MDQRANIIRGVDGRQFIALGNGCYMEVLNQSDPVITDASSYADQECEPLAPETDPVENSGFNHQEVLCEVLSELRKINTRIDGIEQRMDQFVLFSANMDKFMSAKHSTSTAMTKRPEPEEFSDIQELCPISSEDVLQSFEKNLKVKVYADRFFRFFHSEYNMNGKRDGKVFFKIIIRRMIAPPVLQPFSWKGNSRKTDSSATFVPNRSFRDTFPSIVQFVQRVIAAADMDHTLEHTDMCFSQFLRQKRVEIQRFLDNKRGKRAPGSRIRKPKELQACGESNHERQEQEQEQDAEHDERNFLNAFQDYVSATGDIDSSPSSEEEEGDHENDGEYQNEC